MILRPSAHFAAHSAQRAAQLGNFERLINYYYYYIFIALLSANKSISSSCVLRKQDILPHIDILLHTNGLYVFHVWAVGTISA